MARHRRRHRLKNRPSTIIPTSEQAESVGSIPNTRSSTDNLALVRRDLLKTGVVTIVLIIALMTVSYLNTQQQWTLKLGNILYQLLHIR